MKNLPKLNLQMKNPLKNLSKKKKILLAVGTVVLIGVIAVVVSFTSKRNQMKENMEAAFTTETAKIERQTLTNSISATGTVESAETKTVNTSLKDLEVVALYVKEGDYVEEGTVICEFDSADYQEELAKAQHNASINAQIEALEGDYNSDYEDALESAHDALTDVSTAKDDAEAEYAEAEDNLDDAESDLDDAEAAYEKAQKKYNAIADELKATPSALKEYETLYNNALNVLAEKKVDLAFANEELSEAENNSASESELTELKNNVKTAKSAVDTAQDAVNAAKKDYDTASTRYNELQAIESAYKKAQSAYTSAQQEVQQAETALEKNEAALEQAEDQLDSAWETYDASVEKADEQYAKAALEDQLITESQEEKTIDEYTELIEDCVVKASMSGVITSLNVTEGNNFEGGDIYTIQDNEHFIVSATVDEYDISSIKKGMTAYVKTDATGDVEMTGEVTYVAIAPSSTGGAMGAVSSSASYRIEVTIAEPDENLRAGMTAKLSIALEESTDALTVPYDAVTTTPDGNSTITVEVDGEQKTINVETGLETDYYTEVISDEISEGMTVYLSTPMTVSTPESDEEMSFPGGMGGMMNGGNMPDRGGNRGGDGGGGMPSGGGPGGGF